MSHPLILDSLQVRGFRAFEDLRIEKLGRVNLITGKNNVGKSCLLEALQLYARRGAPIVLRHLLLRRDETYYSNSLKQEEAASLLNDIKYLFHGRPDLGGTPLHMTIGSLTDGKNQLSISLEQARVAGDSFLPFNEEELSAVHLSQASMLQLVIEARGQRFLVPVLPSTFGNKFFPGLSDEAIKHTFVWSKGLTDRNLSQWWDEVALTDLEEDVIRALQIISPNVLRLNLVSVREGNPDRTPIVKIKDYPSPLPLKSLGEGINRMLGLTLALVSSGGGILLVDEIETGLHYSVQTDMWRLVFRTAQRLNVQVFATTHSQDCIRSFEEAASEDQNEEAVLVRLENKDGKVAAVGFDERKMAIATREQIEVR